MCLKVSERISNLEYFLWEKKCRKVGDLVRNNRMQNRHCEPTKRGKSD